MLTEEDAEAIQGRIRRSKRRAFSFNSKRLRFHHTDTFTTYSIPEKAARFWVSVSANISPPPVRAGHCHLPASPNDSVGRWLSLQRSPGRCDRRQPTRRSRRRDKCHRHQDSPQSRSRLSGIVLQRISKMMTAEALVEVGTTARRNACRSRFHRNQPFHPCLGRRSRRRIRSFQMANPVPFLHRVGETLVSSPPPKKGGRPHQMYSEGTSCSAEEPNEPLAASHLPFCTDRQKNVGRLHLGLKTTITIA